MLESVKQSYYEQAEHIPGWKDMSRSELCRKYVELKEQNDSMCDSYLSAIIYKFWNVISHNYYNQQVKIATPEDCYTWAIKAIMFVLEQHAWTDPKSSLYKDPNAPEKAINVCISDEKINFFVAQKRYKRRVNSIAYSLDALLEESSDDYYLPCQDNYDLLGKSFIQYIESSFKNKDYLKAFTVHTLLNNPELVEVSSRDGYSTSKINYSKLKQKMLTLLNDTFAEEFSSKYKFDQKVVMAAILSLNYCGEDCINEKILKEIIENMKNDTVVKELGSQEN